MTAIVDHARDHELTVQGAQAACGWALHHLAIDRHHVTGESLPLLCWAVGDQRPALSGLALDSRATARVEAVRKWAAHLGVPVIFQRDGDRDLVEAAGTAYGVRVRVWAQVPTVAVAA